MIKLNKNLKIGMTVNIPAGLSWQTTSKNIKGTYVIADIIDSETVRLIRETDGQVVSSELLLVQYLTGKEVAPKKPGVAINSDCYLPSLTDSNICTDTLSTEINFIYCGVTSDSFGKSIPCLDSDGIIDCDSEWCYLPWSIDDLEE